MNKSLNPSKGIDIKQDVRFGKPTIAGTRIAVADIINLLEGGYDIEDIPRQYPSITLQQVKKALRYAAGILGKEEVLVISQEFAK